MPTLHLLRHVKSSWDVEGLKDFDRPLAPRGERAAGAIAAYLKQNGVAPDLILCSPKAVAVEVTRALYEVGAERILGLVRAVDPGVRVLMLIGHNPGLESLAMFLAGKGSAKDARASLSRKFPSGAFASLEFEGAWADLQEGGARLTKLVTPKDLV
jgi:phosphohistidine phosphatase